MTAQACDIDAWLARGWAIFPCHSVRDGTCSCGKADCDSPGKHPRTWHGVGNATKNPETVHAWVTQYPDANWAVATGAPSDLVVIDLDVKKGKDGYKSFSRFITESGMPEPKTFTVRTGSGGRHLYFRTRGEHVGNRVNWLPGVDIRGDGGYVLLPGSNHISGDTYRVDTPDALEIMPDRLVAGIDSPAQMPSSIKGLSLADYLNGVEEGKRDDTIFKMTCRLRRDMGDEPVMRPIIEEIILRGAANSNPPFPEAQARRKIEQAYKQDHRDLYDLGRMPFVAPAGDLYDFLTDLDPGMVKAVETAVKAAKVRTYAARVLREERVAKYGDSAALDGDAFMFGEVAVDVPIWGRGDDLLWSEGGSLMIASDQGLGKSFTAQQIIAARLSIGPPDLLGLPVHPLSPEKLVVYLALDRPRQISRSMARLFRAQDERETARQRLRIWTKPIPVDVLGNPVALADWLEETFGTYIGDLVIDSIKDLTPADLSSGEVGQSLDMAWKECRARGMNTLLLHHERKTPGSESRANRMPALDNIYGSVWLTSGLDSIIHIQGKQGANIVTYSHLKAILNMLDPVDAIHDQENGHTDVFELSRSDATDKVAQVLALIERGVVTASEIAAQSGHSKASVDRYIKTLREAGRIEEATAYNRSTATPATYRVCAQIRES